MRPGLVATTLFCCSLYLCVKYFDLPGIHDPSVIYSFPVTPSSRSRPNNDILKIRGSVLKIKPAFYVNSNKDTVKFCSDFTCDVPQTPSSCGPRVSAVGGV